MCQWEGDVLSAIVSFQQPWIINFIAGWYLIGNQQGVNDEYSKMESVLNADLVTMST